MLMIIMHQKREFLDALLTIMKKENINDATIIQQEGIGISLMGDRDGPIFHKGSYSSIYDQALVAIIRDNQTARHLYEIIEQNDTLSYYNFEETGYICAVPFNQIKSLGLEVPSIKKEPLKKKIGEYLTHDRVVLDLRAKNKGEAIEEIAALLKNAPEVIDFDTFLREIFEREKLASTAVGNGIAIPHARTDVVENLVLAFGRSDRGIDFDSLDGEPTRLILIMGTPKKKGLNTYLRILAHLSRAFQKESFRNLLLTTSRVQDIIEEFNKISSNLQL
ncbi:MAG: PTS sugar transporter subunit IIA [bacterium]